MKSFFPSLARLSCSLRLLKFSLLVAPAFVASSVSAQFAEMTSPEVGSNIASTVTFTWTNKSTNYELLVGTGGAGTSNIHDSPLINTTSRQVTGIPGNTKVYVRLRTETTPGSGAFFFQDYTYNVDIDNDAILDEIDPNPSVANPKVTKTGPDYTLTVLGSGRVASLQLPAAIVDKANADGLAFSEMNDLTKRIYGQMRDDFDFIFFTSDQPSDAVPSPPYAGSYFPSRNDVAGLGLSIYDGSASFGSAGRLQGAMHLANKTALLSGPSLHELMHRWGAFLTDFPVDDPRHGGHWSYSSVGGQLGGWQTGSLESLGGTSYRAKNPRTGNFGSFSGIANGGNGLRFSDLELYLMGLIPITGQPDIKIAKDFAPASDFGTTGRFTASSILTYSINDLLAKNGARQPDHTASQKDFKVAQIILVKQPLTDGAWRTFDKDVHTFSLPADDGQSFSFNFWEATLGKATLDMNDLQTALATPTPTPAPTATPTPTATATPPPTPTPAAPRSVLANIATRLRVETGENVLIGGFIITGTEPKKLIVRAIGPSSGVPGALADPQLQIVDAQGSEIASNNNWKEQDIIGWQAVIDSGIPPDNDLEAALVRSLNPGAYTALVSGVNDSTGVGLVEAYDLDRSADSELANIATRGLVQTGDDAMIGGLIIVGDAPQKVIVRAIGPSLPLDMRLWDPTLEIYDGNGALLQSNDNWRSDQEADIIATSVPPSHDLESAIVTTLTPAQYTAIVSGVGGTTGVGVVEVYALR